jgi:hypothetical protein
VGDVTVAFVDRAEGADARSVQRLERDPARPDHARHRRQHTRRHLLLARRGHQAADRLLHAGLLGTPPDQTQGRRRCEAEQEGNAAHRPEQRDQKRAQ